jgi:hypothetical protein
MRILKIELAGVLRPRSEGLDLGADEVSGQLYRELDQLRFELAERIRAKAIALLPAEYAVFVRTSFERVGNKALVTFWIDDPSVAGVSGLLARRAWTLSIPILSHVFRESIQERLQTLVVDVDSRAARVSSFAPTRAWYSPLVVGLTAVFLSAAYWFVLHDAIVAAFRRLTG